MACTVGNYKINNKIMIRRHALLIVFRKRGRDKQLCLRGTLVRKQSSHKTQANMAASSTNEVMADDASEDSKSIKSSKKCTLQNGLKTSPIAWQNLFSSIRSDCWLPSVYHHRHQRLLFVYWWIPDNGGWGSEVARYLPDKERRHRQRAEHFHQAQGDQEINHLFNTVYTGKFRCLIRCVPSTLGGWETFVFFFFLPLIGPFWGLRDFCLFFATDRSICFLREEKVVDNQSARLAVLHQRLRERDCFGKKS